MAESLNSGVKEMLYVNSLGDFKISENSNVLDDSSIRSDMLTKLFLYLLLHRNKNLTIDEIAEALWQEDETDNPAGALKNLMYRLRTLLKKQFGQQDFILTRRGAYCWNPEVEVELDVEKLEQLYEASKKLEDPREKIECLEAVIALYKGEFMPKLQDRHWVIQLTTYYHSMFLNSVKSLCELYEDTEQYQKQENVAVKGIQFDHVDEGLYCYHLRALAAQNKFTLMEEVYKGACKTLYEQLGIHEPTQLNENYLRIQKKCNYEQEECIDEIQNNLKEEKAQGVFFCGYLVFSEIYRLEARKIGRLGQALYIVLFTVDGEKTRIAEGIQGLKDVIRNSLRVGDVAAQYSENQYIVMLPTCDQEKSKQVAERIVRKFEEQMHPSLKLRYDSEEVHDESDARNE